MIHAGYGGLATLEESHSHTPVREICSEGVILLDDLCDFWWVSCRMARLQYGAKNPGKVKPLGRVHARHRRQTDDRHTDLPCDTVRNICNTSGILTTFVLVMYYQNLYFLFAGIR